MLDEPRAKQSDPTVLDLQLRTLTKQTTVKPVVRASPHTFVYITCVALYSHMFDVCTCTKVVSDEKVIELTLQHVQLLFLA